MRTKSSHTIPLNARQLAKELLPTRRGEEIIFEEFLLWPPDLFAFTSQILRITGAYHLVISPPRSAGVIWPPVDVWVAPDWGTYVRNVGMTWREQLENNNFNESAVWAYKDQENSPQRTEKLYALTGEPFNKNKRWKKGIWVPEAVGLHWNTLRRGMQKDGIGNIEDILCEDEEDVKKVQKNWEVFKALMTLHAIVDETCVGWGIKDIHFKRGEKPNVWEVDENAEGESTPARFAANLLENNGTLATINNRRGRVLPKRHTPNLGITLRSLTNNLAFHSSSVDVKWRVAKETNAFTERVSNKSKDKNKVFSILLLPWPLNVSALDFEAVPHEKAESRLNMDSDKYGLFYYNPKGARWFDAKFLTAVLDKAKEETSNVDMVILPECALTTAEIGTLESVIGMEQFQVSGYVAGVRNTDMNPGGRVFTDNMVYCKMGEWKSDHMVYAPAGKKMVTSDIQYKHHRWKVDRYQIENYSLGHALSPFKDWWEAIKIRRRKVTFINVGNELTICPLICEDLARQDPIADLIRTVGPSLVITILMDGPQTKERWSARYASVLSEDPGSAVLTLTSAGMVDRWRHPYVEPPRIVALWNDGQGAEREIELEQDSKGILLSLSVSGREERSADGRGEMAQTNRVILGGIRQIKV